MSLKLHATEGNPESLGHQYDEIMDAMTSRTYYRFSRTAKWKPAVNVYEDETHLRLCVELAGMKKEDIRVEVAGDRLVIRGDRAVPHRDRHSRPQCVLRMEIDSGPFERTLEIPERVEVDQIEAELTQGYLWIHLPKRAE
jgi:HSP20 family protein